MEDLTTLIEASSRDGEGSGTHPHAVTDLIEDLTRVSAPDSDPSLGRAATISGDLTGIGGSQLGNTGLTVSAPQHPNVPAFLQVGHPFEEEVTFPGAGNVSEHVRQSSSYDWAVSTHGRYSGGLSEQPATPAYLGHATAVHGSLDKTAILKAKKPSAVLKATNADDRRKRIKARNIYHAQQSRRRRRVRQAVLEQESAWLQRDIRRLEADIRAISEERGLYVDVLLNHPCAERGDITQSQ